MKGEQWPRIQRIQRLNVGKYSLSHMGASKNRGTPKWTIYNGNPLLNGMIWGYHHFRKPPYSIWGIDSAFFFLFPLFSWKVILDGLQIMLNSLQVDLAAQAFSQLEEVG